jgi:hypothetical protein
MATTDISEKVALYRRGKLKEFHQNYKYTEDCAEGLQAGLLFARKPIHPDIEYIGAVMVTENDITQYARTIIHDPIGLRADIGIDGDPSGKYVPLVVEFARDLRQGVPLPSASSQLAALLPQGNSSAPRKPQGLVVGQA